MLILMMISLMLLIPAQILGQLIKFKSSNEMVQWHMRYFMNNRNNICEINLLKKC